MPRKAYGALEEHIRNTFQNDGQFTLLGRIYDVLEVGKPRPQGSGGECKTDVFVRARTQDTHETLDLKISVKNTNREFIGNKLKPADLEAYLGNDWERIIMNATNSNREFFENSTLIYASGHHPIKPNSITVGWKLEVADRSRRGAIRIPLTDQQVKDFIYKGTNQSSEKKDACVNGHVIQNSGVADYLIITRIEDIRSANDIIERMVLINDADIGSSYFIFTANNYRTDVQRADGCRCLAVRIEWTVEDGKMCPSYHYDHPLQYTGQGDMAPMVRHALHQLGKTNVCDLVSGVDVDERLFRA